MNFSRALYVIRQSISQDRFSNLVEADFLVVRHDHNCGFKYKDKVYAQISDSVIDIGEALGFKFSTVAKPFSRYRGSSSYGSSYSFNRDFFIVFVISKVVRFLAGRKVSSALSKWLEKRVWVKILRLVKPKAVVAIQPSLALCSAGNFLGIKVYDYQHGVISKAHRWYGKGLQELKDDKDLPYGILLWDDKSRDVLADFGESRKVELFVVGNPWIERFVFPNDNDELVAQYSGLYGRLGGDRPAILVSLQWGLKEHYYRDMPFNGLMCDALVEVIRNTSCDYNWMLRLHPVQLHSGNQERTLRLLGELFGDTPNIDWDVATKLPLPVVLESANLHITDMSTVVTEAAWFGVPSAIMNPFVRPGQRLEELFIDEREQGIAQVVEQSEPALMRWISEALLARREVVNKSHRIDLERFLASHIQ